MKIRLHALFLQPDTKTKPIRDRTINFVWSIKPFPIIVANNITLDAPLIFQIIPQSFIPHDDLGY
jgi:hypothetical protein